MNDYKAIRKEMFKTPRTVGVGPFEANNESLKNYQCPEWFNDAKFGIWAHWGPQGVPMTGDWYARNMYMEGSPAYKHHLEHYGHPSEQGFKDIFPLWTAENFDPEALMDKYVRAGAKYFVALGVHVDNYDCWDSKYTRWNSTELGPKQDIVGTWKKVARERGLKFGVTEHLSNYYYWFGPSQLADTEGPYKDVLYDGSDPDYKDLYFSGLHGSDINVFNTPDITPAAWNHEWYHRMKDLIDQHEPDLFYIDGASPFGDVGRELMAYYYNQNMASHDNHLEGVFNIKNIPNLCEYVPGTGTLDLERGVANEITEEPWQIDTCIGDWFYKEGINYKTPKQVIEFLVDTVSKNGNLLLNIPLRPDGTLDDYCDNLLEEVGDWIAVNGEAIYETRPWKQYGENVSVKLAATESKNEDDFAMVEKELRFTKKDTTVNVFFFHWPENGQVVISSIDNADAVKSVQLLGCDERIIFEKKDGITVTLPAKQVGDLAYVLKVEFE